MFKHPTLIIAEAGVNHNGSISRAKEMIEVAAQAGADLVKFQTFSADRLVTSIAEKASYQLVSDSDKSTQKELYVYCRNNAIIKNQRVPIVSRQSKPTVLSPILQTGGNTLLCIEELIKP